MELDLNMGVKLERMGSSVKWSTQNLELQEVEPRGGVG